MCFPQAILNGMDSIQKVLQYFSDQRRYPEVVKGYFGPMIENFECDKTFFTAVEVTAGNRYVDTDFILRLVACSLKFYLHLFPCISQTISQHWFR